MLEVLGCPHLMLPYICHVDSFFVGHIAYCVYYFTWVEFGVLTLDISCLFLPFRCLRYPFRVIVLFYKREKLSQEFFDVGAYAKVYEHVFVYFACIYIYLYFPCFFSEFFRVQSYPVAESCSEGYDEIRSVYGFVCGYASVHAYEAEVSLVVISYDACGHKSVGSRYICGLYQLIELFACV